MRHSSSQTLYAMWDHHRGPERAPRRRDLPPDIMRDLLGDMFVLRYAADDHFPLRVAGTRVCALLGQDCKDANLPALFEPSARRDIAALIVEVAEELLVAVAGVAAIGNDGHPVPLELSLFPFRSRANNPLSMVGLLVPMTPSRPPVRTLSLQSWRYLGHRTEQTDPRMLRKLALSRGLTIYEGLG